VEAAIRAVAAKGSKSAHQPLVFSKG